MEFSEKPAQTLVFFFRIMLKNLAIATKISAKSLDFAAGIPAKSIVKNAVYHA
ncbi:MAG: hypothetical protein VB091_13365 [Christensenella sp.]|nr:hypothetical protein [Christensenella sp.]